MYSTITIAHKSGTIILPYPKGKVTTKLARMGLDLIGLAFPTLSVVYSTGRFGR